MDAQPNQQTSNSKRPPNRGERGAAMVVVIALLIGLLAGGITVLFIQIQSSRGMRLINDDRRALYCAEGGLPTAIEWIKQHSGGWISLLNTTPNGGPDPVPLELAPYPIYGDFDGEAGDDFVITFRDNDDEPTGSNDPFHDVDQKVLMIITCIKYLPEAPRYVQYYIEEKGETGSVGCGYRDVGGQGCGNTNNANRPPPPP